MEVKESRATDGLSNGHVTVHDGPTPQSSQTAQAVQDIAFGSLAGIVGKFVEYPFDTVKVRLQSQTSTSAVQYAGPWDCFKQSFRHEGIRGLYRGISAPLVGAAAETSSLFFTYRLAQNALQATAYTSSTPLPMSALLLCGAISGAATSLILTPIELVKCKMQVPILSGATSVARRPLSIIATVFRHQGLLGFWHGHMGTLIRETGGSAAWFGSYEGIKLLFRQSASSSNAIDSSENTDIGVTASPAQPMYQQLIAGAVAGMSYNFVFYPADTIKSRMQTEEIVSTTTAKQSGQTFLSVGRAIWHERGLAGLYRGCGITVLRAAPSSAFIFTIYEGLKRAFA